MNEYEEWKGQDEGELPKIPMNCVGNKLSDSYLHNNVTYKLSSGVKKSLELINIIFNNKISGKPLNTINYITI